MGNGCTKPSCLGDASAGYPASVCGDDGSVGTLSDGSNPRRPIRDICSSCRAQSFVKDGDVEGLLTSLSRDPSLVATRLGCACASLPARLRCALTLSHSLCTFICQEGDNKLELLQAVSQFVASGIGEDAAGKLLRVHGDGPALPPRPHDDDDAAPATQRPAATPGSAPSEQPIEQGDTSGGHAAARSSTAGPGPSDTPHPAMSSARKQLLALFLDRPDSRKQTALMLACHMNAPEVVRWLVLQVGRWRGGGGRGLGHAAAHTAALWAQCAVCSSHAHPRAPTTTCLPTSVAQRLCTGSSVAHNAHLGFHFVCASLCACGGP